MTVTVDRTVEEFTAAPRKLFINGQWEEAQHGRTIDINNPATGELLTTVPDGEGCEIDRAVAEMRRASGLVAGFSTLALSAPTSDSISTGLTR